MTRDEILAQYGQSAAAAEPAEPMTRDRILEQYGQAPPDPSTSFGMEMGDQILSAGGLTPSAAPPLAGALNYVKEGGAEGSYDRGYQGNIARHEQSRVANPRAALLGDVGAAVLPIPGVAAAAAPRLAARAVEGALRWGGRAGQGLSAYSIWNDLQRGETPGVGELLSLVAGRGSGKLANVMRDKRLSGSAAKLAEEVAPAAGRIEPTMSISEGPTGPANWPSPLAEVLKKSKEAPPPTGTLSAEMRAALKRNKFRHDYSTGEWRDLLAPGE